MRILFKFMFKNISEKKLRSLLIIISIMVATAMSFASMGISKSYASMVLERMKSKVGEADLVISSKKDSINPFLDEEKLNNNTKEENAVHILDAEGSYKNQDDILKVNIKATDIKELNFINQIVLSKESKGYDLNKVKNNQVIISKKLKDKLGLNIGSLFKVKINKKEVNLKVAAVAVNKGIFLESLGEMNLVMDRQGLYKELGINPSITTVLVKVKGNSTIEQVKEKYEKNFENYKISETISKEDLDNRVKQFTIPFYVMLIVVILMAAFIISSAYKVIVLERMAVIGTFRSIGATRVSTDLILLMESLLYGIIGGILGDILGIPILNYMADSSNMFKNYGVETIVVIDKINFLWAFLLAIFLCIIGSIVPIIKASKISLKDIIFGTFSENSSRNILSFILGVTLFIVPYIYIKKFKWTGNFLFSILAAFSVFLSMIFIIPYVMKLFCYIFKEVYRVIFGNEGAIALDNIGKSKVLINNGILLSSTLAAVVVIYIASSSVSGLITKGYSKMNYDLKIEQWKDKDMINKLKDIEYIKDFQEEFILNEVEVKNKDFKIRQIQGIESNKYLDFYKDVNIYDYKNNKKEYILKKLDKGRNIIISDILEKRQKFKIGDKISLKLEDQYKEYTIVGFAESEFISNGQIALVSSEIIKKDMNIQIGNFIKVKTRKNNNELDKKLREDLEKYNVVITKKSDDLKTDLEVNKGLMNSLESFSLMSLIIGSLGMMNNLMVSFIYRKREFAVLASVGMSKLKRGKLLFIEGITLGVFGGILGVLEGVYISMFLGEITYSLDSYIITTIPLKLIILLGFLAVVLVIVASFVPIFKSSNMSIVEKIKYE
ncbi:FtsX-like permease family protein [Clostridium sporogenes]|uniref:ABC transporter permease n=1 Tax=Clostridium sporogenes TaxID=1509 RepID=UPI0013C6E074|nr:FtsX-like permease family protein [Clostridium sporogenes]NFQ02406.1 FtsX-like permease family protein [Clostridium sporogenes]NFQ42347.1 FtsX-like permease family protein [Clostridium sporogenes]NFT03387.1 FtsX-like permease family protein [Clostridium sporogenes]NFT33372.1 FtsX-like permease family protein [Clostridium sporogenes]NFT38273.1 FtsX-like permease family protein [Clostridium sporogenes]